ncbi:MAG: WG repeat-containing protein, partial [Flavobacterium sp.]
MMRINNLVRAIVILFLTLSINYISAQTKTLTPIQKNGKWGFADEGGVVIIACEYEKVAPFKNGFAVVYNNCVTFHPYGDDVATHYRECKQGVINSYGKLVVPIEYASIGDFNEKGIAKAYRAETGAHSKKVGYIDESGNELMPFIYYESSFFRGGGFTKLLLDGKVGLLSKDGEILIPVHYDEIKATNKYVNYADIPSWAIIQIRLGNKWG